MSTHADRHSLQTSDVLAQDRLLEITGDYRRLLETTGDYWKLIITAKVYSIPQHTVANTSDLWTSMEIPKLFSNTKHPIHWKAEALLCALQPW